MWNVKVRCAWTLFRLANCINRNIVECKEIHAYLKLQTSYVLIETLWNVKRANISDIMAWNEVLIETLWNVKDFFRCGWCGITGINRNIVECKVLRAFNDVMNRQVLIETLWNVKIWKPWLHWLHGCINRNIVECKEHFDFLWRQNRYLY